MKISVGPSVGSTTGLSARVARLHLRRGASETSANWGSDAGLRKRVGKPRQKIALTLDVGAPQPAIFQTEKTFLRRRSVVRFESGAARVKSIRGVPFALPCARGAIRLLPRVHGKRLDLRSRERFLPTLPTHAARNLRSRFLLVAPTGSTGRCFRGTGLREGPPV